MAFTPAAAHEADVEVDCDNEDLTALTPNTNPNRNDWAIEIIETLNNNGYCIDLLSMGFSELLPRVFGHPNLGIPGAPVPTFAEGGYDMLFIGYGWGPEPEIESSYGTDSDANFYNYSSPALDELLAEYAGSDDPATAVQIQQLLHNDEPAAILHGGPDGLGGSFSQELSFNHIHPQLDTACERAAISRLIERQGIIDRHVAGPAAPAATIWQPQWPGYDPTVLPWDTDPAPLPCLLEVEIDVKPGRIELEWDDGEWEVDDPDQLRVIVYSTGEFDASLIDAATATIGDPNLRGTAQATKPKVKDKNKDGLDDLILRFRTNQLLANGGLDQFTTTLELRAIADGIRIRGASIIKVTT